MLTELEHLFTRFSLQFEPMARRNIIGERVRLAREKAKPFISQSDLAARLQVRGLRIERVTISKIETGIYKLSIHTGGGLFCLCRDAQLNQEGQFRGSIIRSPSFKKEGDRGGEVNYPLHLQINLVLL